MAVDWSKVPAGKSYLDRRTIGGEVKYWDPGNPLLFGRGGSWQSQGALDAKRKESGLGPISQSQEWKKSSWNKPVAPAADTSTQLTPAQRATQERQALQVVSGGKAGYRSLMPKPTQQKGETAQQLQQRTDRWNRSQQLAQRLTQQVKDQQRAAAPAADTKPEQQKPEQQKPEQQKPEQQPPASRPQPLPVQPAPASTSTTTTTPAPKPKSWAEANPRLAEVERLRKQQRDAGKSVFDKEFRTNVINPVMYNAGGRSVEASKKMYPDKTQKEEKMDAFDLVLEYLLSEGHTDTVEEALYVMMEMDAETIGSIVEAYQEPKFNRKNYLKKLSKRGGMGMGTPEDPHGYRDPKMAKVGAEFVARTTAAKRAQQTGEPNTYRAEREKTAAANRARGAAKRGEG